jgi:hypothetical protein
MPNPTLASLKNFYMSCKAEHCHSGCISSTFTKESHIWLSYVHTIVSKDAKSLVTVFVQSLLLDLNPVSRSHGTNFESTLYQDSVNTKYCN